MKREMKCLTKRTQEVLMASGLTDIGHSAGESASDFFLELRYCLSFFDNHDITLEEMQKAAEEVANLWSTN